MTNIAININDDTIPGATRLGRSDNSAATMARLRFERTGERTSPFRSRPERETYIEVETWVVDGHEMKRRRDVHVWAGQYSFGCWTLCSASGSV